MPTITRPAGNSMVWSNKERQQSMFEEVEVRWSPNWPEKQRVELHAYQPEWNDGAWYAWVYRPEWHRDYGEIGVTLFAGDYATEARAQSACREFIANYERRTLADR